MRKLMGDLESTNKHRSHFGLIVKSAETQESELGKKGDGQTSCASVLAFRGTTWSRPPGRKTVHPAVFLLSTSTIVQSLRVQRTTRELFKGLPWHKYSLFKPWLLMENITVWSKTWNTGEAVVDKTCYVASTTIIMNYLFEVRDMKSKNIFKIC